MNGTGSLKSQPPGYTFSTDSYTMFQMIFVSSGRLWFTCTDPGHEVKNDLSAGDFLLLREGSRFTLACTDEGYGGICYIDYEPVDVRETGFSFAFRGGHWLDELVGLMQFALAHPRLYRKETLTLMAQSIAWQALDEGISKTRGEGSVSMAEYWTDQIRHIVHSTLYAGQEEYRKRIASLELSYRQLSRYFKVQTAMSIKHYHVSERIREAKRLLLDAGLSVTAVAYELNFASSQKFATQFRAFTGVSPREFADHCASH